ncbi:MAG: hypothetical protein PVJ01_02765 [Pseudomonadota bacterium]
MKSVFLPVYLTLVLALVVSACWDGGSWTYTPDPISLVSVDSDGVVGDDDSYFPALSSDGYYVAFYSFATNLVPSDANGQADIFLHDTETGLTSRVSVSTAGTEANNYNGEPAVSGDGRYVVFTSSADNLVPSDTNLDSDVFMHDTVTAMTWRVSVSSAGTEGNAGSFSPDVSTDGRYVSFISFATNMFAEAASYITDAFVRDTVSPLTTHVSVSSAGTPANGVGVFDSAISGNGNVVAFYGGSDNLVPGDNNDVHDMFIHDLGTAMTSRVSVSTMGTEADAASGGQDVSADGHYVVFASSATNLVPDDTNGYQDVFLRDTQRGITSRVSVSTMGTEGNYPSIEPGISADGRYVVFSSMASNLVEGDNNSRTDIFLRDTRERTTTLLTKSAEGDLSNGDSHGPAISADGRVVVFHSEATNLVANTIPADTVQIYRVGVP